MSLFINCVSGGRSISSFYLQREMNLIGWSVPIYRIGVWLAVFECNSSVLIISGDSLTSSSIIKITKENVTDQIIFKASIKECSPFNVMIAF